MRVRLLPFCWTCFWFGSGSCRQAWVGEVTDVLHSGGCLDHWSVSTGHRKLRGADRKMGI